MQASCGLRDPTRWCPSTRPAAGREHADGRAPAGPRDRGETADGGPACEPAAGRSASAALSSGPLLPAPTPGRGDERTPSKPGPCPGTTASGPTARPRCPRCARGTPRVCRAPAWRSSAADPSGSSPAAPARPGGPVAAGPSDPPRSSPTVPRPTRVLAGPPGGTVSPACRDAAPSVPEVHDSTTVATATADRPWVKCHRTDGRRRSTLPSLPGRGTRSAARPLAPSEVPGPLGQSASRSPGRSARPPPATRRRPLGPV